MLLRLTFLVFFNKRYCTKCEFEYGLRHGRVGRRRLEWVVGCPLSMVRGARRGRERSQFCRLGGNREKGGPLDLQVSEELQGTASSFRSHEHSRSIPY